jgi:transposase
MKQLYHHTVGIDWSTKDYQVSVVDSTGAIVDEFVVSHSNQGMVELVDRLGRHSGGDSASVGVSIEIPRGAAVETLIKHGFHVYSINPKQLDRFRDRHTVAGAKDDRRDAYVLADSLRTDLHLFRRLAMNSAVVVQIREFSRADEEIGTEINRLTSRLREQLHRFFPQMLKLSPSADDPWIWTLLDAASTPRKARALRANRIERILKEHRIRRVGTREVIAELAAPDLFVGPGTTEAAEAHIRFLLPRLHLLHSQRKVCEKEMKRLLQELPAGEDDQGNTNEHRDVDVILSLPGIGIRIAATMLAEADEAIAARDLNALRSHGGSAPVTRRSGTRKLVLMRRACNNRLRDALYHMARVGASRDPGCQRIYAALRRRGHGHGRALRSVANHQLKILLAMLRANTLYDPAYCRRVPTEIEKEAA